MVLDTLPSFVGLNVTGSRPEARAATFIIPLLTSNWSEDDVTSPDEAWMYPHLLPNTPYPLLVSSTLMVFS